MSVVCRYDMCLISQGPSLMLEMEREVLTSLVMSEKMLVQALHEASARIYCTHILYAERLVCMPHVTESTLSSYVGGDATRMSEEDHRIAWYASVRAKAQASEREGDIDMGVYYHEQRASHVARNGERDATQRLHALWDAATMLMKHRHYTRAAAYLREIVSVCTSRRGTVQEWQYAAYLGLRTCSESDQDWQQMLKCARACYDIEILQEDSAAQALTEIKMAYAYHVRYCSVCMPKLS
jgi:hypothetical protein